MSRIASECFVIIHRRDKWRMVCAAVWPEVSVCISCDKSLYWFGTRISSSLCRTHQSPPHPPQTLSLSLPPGKRIFLSSERFKYLRSNRLFEDDDDSSRFSFQYFRIVSLPPLLLLILFGIFIFQKNIFSLWLWRWNGERFNRTVCSLWAAMMPRQKWNLIHKSASKLLLLHRRLRMSEENQNQSDYKSDHTKWEEGRLECFLCAAVAH